MSCSASLLRPGVAAGLSRPSILRRSQSCSSTHLLHRQSNNRAACRTSSGRRTSPPLVSSAARSSTAEAQQQQPPIGSGGSGDDSHETDVVVIGSGVGGLCCAALLAKYGFRVTVCESHDVPGGCAHSWVHPKGYHFESGPSLYSGMAATGPAANPLSHVFQAIDEPLDLIEYKTWNVLLPEGEFLTEVGAQNFKKVLREVRGEAAVQEWQDLQDYMRPLAEASAMLPPIAMRGDIGVIRTVMRYWKHLIKNGGQATRLTGPFSDVIEGVVKDPFIKNWLDLLSFMLSGLPCDGTIAAEVAFMFNEWYRPECTLEFPRGGSGAMIDALVRGLEKNGGRIMLKSHVDEIVVEDGRATGIRLKSGSVIRATKAVVSNATIWDTVNHLLPKDSIPQGYLKTAEEMPKCRSFMHLHLGFEAAGLPEDLEMHHIVVNSWDGGVDTEQNVVLICIASIQDPSLAPEGKHVLHAYTPATEPYELWEGVKRGSPEYKKLKEERSQVLWNAVERIIPDIRERVDVELVGSPLTHERFNRRHRGSYGPAVIAGTGLLPGPNSPIPGLMCCGDTTFPGIGLPATAASGALVANTLAKVGDHIEVLESIGL